MTTSDADVTRMKRIIGRMRAEGLRVVEQSGWQSRGHGGSFSPRGVLEHHDASGVSTGEWGLLGYIRDEGLAQFQVSREGAWAVVAAGKCWHAGKGGPWQGIPQDAGNTYLYGVEVANNGINEPYSPALHQSLDIGLACILHELGAPVRRLGGHKEWAPTRKIDPRHSMGWRRDRVAAHLARLATRTPASRIPDLEDDMPLTDADAVLVARAVHNQLIGKSTTNIGQALERLLVAAGQPVDVDEAAIAAELAAKLPAAVARLDAQGLAAVAKAVNDEFARRQAS